MRNLYIRSVTGEERMLSDYYVSRKMVVNGDKTITANCIKTSKNKKGYALIMNENIFIYEGEEYVIKKVKERVTGQTSYAEATCIHRFFDDMGNGRVYDTISGTFDINTLLNFTFSGSGYSFVVSDSTLLSKRVQVDNFGDSDRLSLYKSILEKFVCEFEVIGRTAYLATEIARYTNEQMRYNFNVQEPSKEIDTSSFATYIRGYGKVKEDKDTLSGQSIPYESRAGTYYSQDGQLATKTKNSTFTFSFTGTGCSLKTIVHPFGGKWKFEFGDTSKTITTYAKTTETKSIDIFRGLESKKYTVKATFTGKDSNNPNTKDKDAYNFLLDGNIINIFRAFEGDEIYTAIAEYTSPLASVYGPKHAPPVRDDRFTDKASLLAEIKRQLNDTIEISLSAEVKQLNEKYGIKDIRAGDYLYCIIDPFEIDTRIRVVEYEDYSDPAKSPKCTLGTLRKKASATIASLNTKSKNIDSVIDPTTGKVKTSSLQADIVNAARTIDTISRDGGFDLTRAVGILSEEHVNIGPNTVFEPGYDPSQIANPEYELATETINGLMAAADKKKLNQISIQSGQAVNLSSLAQAITNLQDRVTALEGGN